MMNGRTDRSLRRGVSAFPGCFALIFFVCSGIGADCRAEPVRPQPVAPPISPSPPSASITEADAARLETGSKCLVAGDTQGAILAFTTVAADAPKSPAPYHLLAVAYLQAGRPQPATQAAKTALANAPSAGAGHAANACLLGLTYYRDYQTRLSAWRAHYAGLPQAIQLFLQMSTIHHELPDGDILLEHGDTEAGGTYESLRDSVIADARVLSDLLTHSDKAYRDAIAADPATPTAHDGLGLVLAAEDESGEAHRELQRELDLHGPSSIVYQHLGELEAEDKDYDAAVTDLRHAVALGPRATVAYDDLALAYQGEKDEVDADWARGMAQMLRGKPEDAERLFQKAMPSADARRGEAMVCLLKNQPDQARSCLTDALKTAPQDARTLTMLGDVEAGQSRWDKALDAYRRALAADPDTDAAWYGVGLSDDKLNKPIDAIAAYAKALSLNPENSLARLNIAADEVDAGQKQAAIGDMREYLKRFPLAHDSGDVKVMLEQTESSL